MTADGGFPLNIATFSGLLRIISGLFCNFAAERLRNCSRSAIDASIIALAQPQFWQQKFHINTYLLWPDRLKKHPSSTVRTHDASRRA